MRALRKLGIIINLSAPAVKLNIKKIEATETEAGHLVWRLETLKADNKSEMVFQAETKHEEREWSMNDIRRLHQRFCHTSKKTGSAVGKCCQKRDNERNKKTNSESLR